MVSYAPRHGDQKIPYGPLRRRMALHRPASSRVHRAGPPKASRLADDLRRRILRPKERLPLEAFAPRLSAMEERLRVVQEVAHRRYFRAPQRPPCESGCGLVWAGTRTPARASPTRSPRRLPAWAANRGATMEERRFGAESAT